MSDMFEEKWQRGRCARKLTVKEKLAMIKEICTDPWVVGRHVLVMKCGTSVIENVLQAKSSFEVAYIVK